MTNRGMLSRRSEDRYENTEKMIQLLINKFGASHYEHPFLDYLILLNSEIWLVVSSTIDDGVAIYDGNDYVQHELIRELDMLNAGILIFKQSTDDQLQIYLLDNTLLLKKYCDYKFFIKWDNVEKIKRLSELGIVLDSELIGFCVDDKNHFNISHYTPISNAKTLFGQ